MNLKRNFSKVFSVNIISLVVGVVTAFMLPVILDIEQYAIYKTYGLFISFIGLMAFGFIDGMYVNYGGKKLNEINKRLFKYEHNFLMIMQALVTLILISASIILDDKILFYFSLTILPFTMLGFFKLFYQAIGEFTRFTLLNISSVVLIFLFNILLIFLGVENAFTYILMNVAAYYIVFIFVEIFYFFEFKGVKTKFNSLLIVNNFKIGIFMLLGNLSSILFYSLDRWFIKIFFDLPSFAYYSFAISMMSLIILFINSTTSVLYPYFSSKSEIIDFLLMKKYLLIIGSLTSLGYFCFAIIVVNFIPKYTPSLSIISILFAGFPAIIVIRALYINLYTIQKKQKLYSKTVLVMLIISILFNAIALLSFKTSFSIAAATTLSFYMWYFYSAKHFKKIPITYTEVFFLVLFNLLFITTSSLSNIWLGLCLCISGLLIINWLFFNKIFKNLFSVKLKKI